MKFKKGDLVRCLTSERTVHLQDSCVYVCIDVETHPDRITIKFLDGTPVFVGIFSEDRFELVYSASIPEVKPKEGYIPIKFTSLGRVLEI